MEKLDLRQHLHVIHLMQERKMSSAESYKMGLVRESFSGVNSYEKGEVVLFKESKTGNDVTVERPMSMIQINEQESRGSLLLTFGTMVAVPERFITEIVFS